MKAADYFSTSYGQARSRFLQACSENGALIESFEIPVKGPQGEPLYTDVALFGRRDADKLLILISGTHGVEGLCGSACQLAWTQSGEYEGYLQEIAVLLIHIINPYGAAWNSRFTEEGVDLNRNFVKHDGHYPENPGYEAIHGALLCPVLQGPERDEANKQLQAFRIQHGDAAAARALWGGQYTHPDGNNFGGHEPVRAHRLSLKILSKYAAASRHVAVIDYHTGLGPFAYGMPICSHLPDSEEGKRVKAWFGESVRMPEQQQDVTPGDTNQGYVNALPDVRVTAITLEFGTFNVKEDISSTLHALWLNNYGDPLSETGMSIRKAVQNYFYPDTDDWREMIWFRSQQVIRQAIRGLYSS